MVIETQETGVVKKNIYLFCCQALDPGLTKKFDKIRSAIKRQDRAMILFHQTEAALPGSIHSYPHTTFSYNELSRLGYSMFRETLVPGSTHFPLINFYRNNSEYSYYWLIEYDVSYTGNWMKFFNYWDARDTDLLTGHIREYASEPDWTWWGLEHPDETIPLEKRLRSFNPIYRLSNRAIAFIDEKHQENWRGHYEELLPTLLHHNGFSIRDFGGTGQFVHSEERSRFYIDAPDDREGLLKKGTMRWRPVFNRPGWRRNKLYHPVKGKNPVPVSKTEAMINR